MCARSFLGWVAQWQVVLGGLLPIVERCCRIHWNHPLSGTTLRPQTLVAVGDGATNDLLGSRCVWVLTCDQSRRMLESWTWIDPKHLLRSRSNNTRLRLPMRRLAQIMFKRRIAQISRRPLQLLNILRDAEAALLILQLLHIEIRLHLVRVVVKVLVYLLFSRGVILAYSHLRVWTLVLKSWVYSDLVT